MISANIDGLRHLGNLASGARCRLGGVQSRDCLCVCSAIEHLEKVEI